MRNLSIDLAFGSRLHIFIHQPTRLGSPEQPQQPIRINHYVTRVVSQLESITKNPSTSSANQNRVLRNPSRQPIRIEHGKNPSTSSANQNRVLRSPSRQTIGIEHGKNPSTSSANHNRVLRNPSRQPIKSSITSPESSRLGWRSFLGSRLESARYSLS